jgi:Protein of unknown function (DUF2530)
VDLGVATTASGRRAAPARARRARRALRARPESSGRPTQRAAREQPRKKASQRIAARLGLPERRPDPPPLETNEVRVLYVGTLAWLVAFVILLPYYDRLMTAGRAWWVWTCLAGFGLGLWGIYLVRRRRAALARDEDRLPLRGDHRGDEVAPVPRRR